MRRRRKVKLIPLLELEPKGLRSWWFILLNPLVLFLMLAVLCLLVSAVVALTGHGDWLEYLGH